MDQPPSQFGYPEPSQALMVLVFGVLGLLFFPLISPVAWVLGRREKRAIDSGLRPPEGMQMARIGTVLGVIGTCLWVVFAIMIALILWGVASL